MTDRDWGTLPTRIFENINTHGMNYSVCWEWTGTINQNGIAQLSHDGKKWAAYRVMYELFIGDIPDGMVVRHKCNNGARSGNCCNPMHLVLGTIAENNADKGESHSHGTSVEVVRQMRAHYRGDGDTPKLRVSDIATLYNMPRETVRDIVKGRRKTYIKD